MEIDDFQVTLLASNGPAIHLHVVGPPGTNCILQTSTNLSAWTPIATNTLLGGDWFFDKFLATGQPTLFYRAKLSP